MFGRQFPENPRALTRSLLGTFPESFLQCGADLAVVRRLLNHWIERASAAGNHDLAGIILCDPFEKLDIECGRTFLVERRGQEVVLRNILDRYVLDRDLYGLVGDRLFDMHMNIDE